MSAGLRQRLADGDVVLSLGLDFPHPAMAEFASRLGFDCLVIDFEHGPLDERVLEEFCRACDLGGTIPIVCAPADPQLLERCANVGARGVQVAQVRSAAHAAEVVRAVKFPPIGSRGLGRCRANHFGTVAGGYPEFITASNDSMLVVLHVENLAAVDAIPQIAEIKDVDVLFIGAIDLANDMGLSGDLAHPRVQAAVDRAIAAAAGAGKAVGLSASSAADAERAILRGARYILASEARCLIAGVAPLRDSVRKTLPPMRLK